MVDPEFYSVHLTPHSMYITLCHVTLRKMKKKIGLWVDQDGCLGVRQRDRPFTSRGVLLEV